jgi:hypothetical protein
MISNYRQIRIDTHARLTSATGDNPCTSVSSPDSHEGVSEKAPDFFDADIAKKISAMVNCTYEQGVDLLRDASNFLWLASHSENVSVPSPIVDEAWHVFVLFTKEYIQFCNTYCGGYVHHAPHVGPEIRMTEEYVKPTIDLMYELFEDVPSKNWEYISVKDWLLENKLAA